jgi:hypothetical protein
LRVALEASAVRRERSSKLYEAKAVPEELTRKKSEAEFWCSILA